MRLVVALGGNALLRRGMPMTTSHQRAAIATACAALAPVAAEHELIVTHGNGPQIGLLALQAAAYDDVSTYPLDVLGAQTDGMIGYLIEQELGNLLPPHRRVATLLTMIEVDPADPAFAEPTKFVGPNYPADGARRLAAEHGWTVAPDGDSWRRVVASPQPHRIVEMPTIRLLVDSGRVVVCAGGGGIPTMREPGSGRMIGVEAVIDKDRASAVLARDLDADTLIIATDIDAVHVDWGTPAARAVALADPRSLLALDLPAGSMGPKVEAAADFTLTTGRDSVIGALTQLPELLAGSAGTRITLSTTDLALRQHGASRGISTTHPPSHPPLDLVSELLPDQAAEVDHDHAQGE